MGNFKNFKRKIKQFIYRLEQKVQIKIDRGKTSIYKTKLDFRSQH